MLRVLANLVFLKSRKNNFNVSNQFVSKSNWLFFNKKRDYTKKIKLFFLIHNYEDFNNVHVGKWFYKRTFTKNFITSH